MGAFLKRKPYCLCCRFIHHYMASWFKLSKYSNLGTNAFNYHSGNLYRIVPEVSSNWKRLRVLIAERLSARQLIVQRSHIASVYIYVYIYIYIRHTLIARGRGRLHRCCFCGPDSHVLVHVRNAKKRSIQGKETLPQKRVRQRRESLTD